MELKIKNLIGKEDPVFRSLHSFLSLNFGFEVSWKLSKLDDRLCEETGKYMEEFEELKKRLNNKKQDYIGPQGPDTIEKDHEERVQRELTKFYNKSVSIDIPKVALSEKELKEAIGGSKISPKFLGIIKRFVDIQ